MPEASVTPSVSSVLLDALKRQILAVQDYSLLAFRSVANVLTPPHYWSDTLEQMDLIGVGSLPIVVIASVFIGGVMVLQTAAQFERFGETALTGDAVALALVRELGNRVAVDELDPLRDLGLGPGHGVSSFVMLV